MMPFVMTNGCFDILHAGHLDLLKYCFNICEGGIFEILLDSDEKIKRDKGINRPYFSYKERKENLYNTGYVQCVYKFNTDKELSFAYHELKPDIIVKGSDWMNKHVVGSNSAKEVKYYEQKVNISTSEIEKRILEKDTKCNCNKDIIKSLGLKIINNKIICINCGKYR
jgi:D-beta-D-heptose 7-phosphate kinase/D-beta-D-heptose 1-phosphate adenosyltransferase